MPHISHRSGQLVDVLLTNLGRKYTPAGFIAEQVCPRVGVAAESGIYPVWTRADFLRTGQTDPLIANGAETKDVDFSVTTEAYLCEEYALRTKITRRERENSSDVLGLRQTKANGVRDLIALHREKRVATLLASVDNSVTVDTNWDQDAATIEVDIKEGKELVYDDIGRVPNSIVIPWKVANAVSLQADIREVLKYTVNGQQILAAGEAILPANLWGLKVIVPQGPQYTDSAEDASASFSEVWGTDVLVLYLNGSPDKDNPSVAYTLQTRGVEVKSWMSDDPEVEYIRVSDGVLVEKLTAPAAGAKLGAVL
jgi:hypothetical protein